MNFIEQLRELRDRVTRIGWTVDTRGNICRGMLPLFKKTGADDEDAALIVLLRNNLDEIISALEGVSK